MKALVCEMCSSQDLMKVDGVFVCQNCGTKYSVEEAKKMMVEGTVDIQGVVKVDASEELQNLYQVARRAKEDGNSESAAKYYDMILVKDPTSWEAAFYTVYFKAMETKIMHIYSAAVSVDSCLNGVFQLIKEHVKTREEQEKAIKEVTASVSILATLLMTTARNHYKGIDSSIRDQYFNEMLSRCNACIDLMYNCGTYINEVFDTKELRALAVSAWKLGITLNDQREYVAVKDLRSTYNEKIVCLVAEMPECYTKEEMEGVKEYAEKLRNRYRSLKYDKENRGKIYLVNMLFGAIISAIFTGVVFLFVWLFSDLESAFSSAKILLYVFLGGFALATIGMCSINGVPSQSVEELTAELTKNEALLEKIEEAIKSK